MVNASMHSLEPTGLYVDALFSIGPEPEWAINGLESAAIDLNGIEGDRHYGPSRTIRAYESPDLAGLKVANEKQLSLVFGPDMVEIAEGLDLPTDRITEATGETLERFMAGQLAANILLKSTNEQQLNDTAQAGVAFIFGDESMHQKPSVRISEYNPPCSKPMRRLVASMIELGITPPTSDMGVLSSRFKELAAAKRGFVGSVYSSGTIAVGQHASLYHPLGLPV